MSRRRLVVATVALAAALLLVGALALARTAAPGQAEPSGPTETVPAPIGLRTVPAPIDGLEVRRVQSAPPRYTASITAGLPSGCAKQHSHAVSRSGDTITVTVLNSMPPGDPICTMIYGMYELDIDLGSDFRPGSTYTVRANERTTTFTAR